MSPRMRAPGGCPTLRWMSLALPAMAFVNSARKKFSSAYGLGTCGSLAKEAPEHPAAANTTLLDHPHVRQVPVAVVQVEAVADDEAVLDGETKVVDRHGHARAGRLVQERAYPHARRASRAQEVDQVRHRQAGVDDVLDEKDVLVFDGSHEILCDLDDAGGLRPLAVRPHPEKIDPERQVDGSREIRGEHEAPFQHTDQDEVTTGVVPGDLFAELTDPSGDLHAGEHRGGELPH